VALKADLMAAFKPFKVALKGVCKGGVKGCKGGV